MLTVVLALTVIRVKAQDAEPGFVDEAEILTPEYEDNNFDDFVGRNKRAIILFFYENNVK